MMFCPDLGQVAERGLQQLRQLDTEAGAAAGPRRWSWRLEEAHAHWHRGENETAKHLLKALIHSLKPVQSCIFAPLCNIRCYNCVRVRTFLVSH